jgi:raffinose/stachyose/melibiose transport system substrate-binding protein
VSTSSLRHRPVLNRRIGLVSVLVASVVLAGCSSGSASGPAAKGGAPTGTLKFIVSSSDASDAGFRAVNAAFMKKYPAVKIEFSAVPNDNFAATNASRLTAGNVDITLAGPKELPAYVPQSAQGDDARAAEAGVYVDLTKEPMMKRFTPSVLKTTKFKGKQYTVPTGVSYYTGVYYNKTLFAKYGLAVPTTWDEFVSLGNTLRKNGVAPLGIGGKDGWPAGLTMMSAAQGLYPTALDKQNLDKGVWQKTVKLTDSTPVKVLKRVQTMYGFAQKNFTGVAYSAIPAGFAKGEFAMTADGTWNEPTIASAVGSKFKFGYFPVPTSDNAAENATLGGKIELTLAVPTSAKNKTAALAYLDFFSQPVNYTTFVKLAGFASSEPGIATSEFLKSIQGYTKTFSPAWDTVFVSNPKAGQAAAFPFNYVGLAPLGAGTPEQAAAQAQKDWAAGF